VALNRNAIIDALVQRLSTVEGVKTVTRTVKQQGQWAPEDFPVLSVYVSAHEADTAGPRTIWRIQAVAEIAVREDSAQGPEETFLTILDALERRLEADPTEPHDPRSPYATSLGGLVMYCRMTGAFDIQETDDRTVIMAAVPLEIGALA
jgi:hypothetical protein